MLARRLNTAFPPVAFPGGIDRFFDSVFGAEPALNGPSAFAVGQAYPPVNVWEDESNVYLEAELPGMRMEDLDITLLGAELTLSGRRETQTDRAPQGGATCHRRERVSSAFSTSATARSSCGSRPPMTDFGSFSTSMSGPTP